MTHALKQSNSVEQFIKNWTTARIFWGYKVRKT